MGFWAFPSYSGDFRLIAVEDSRYRDQGVSDACVLEIVDPAIHEMSVLATFLAKANEKKWTPVTKVATVAVETSAGISQRQEVLLSTSIGEAGQMLYELVRPADRTVTAVRSVGGRVEVYETADLQKVADALTADTVVEAPEKGAKKKGEKAAVSVKRPTPCCPQCVPGVMNRASEVMYAFLTPQERRTWDAERFIVIEGGLSGHRYMLAHRHSRYAIQAGRICFDLDDDITIHFHDNSVPPEEEVLAAKLILEHREPWLRNEATTFAGEKIFKNPFGNHLDGVESAIQTQEIGNSLRMLFGS